ncbi:MAG: DNA repair protein RecN [Bacteroidales bacterium]|nr:DNA repair protein RecN [Bacteroidales bacterium]
MLRALHISHYILIDSLDIEFPEGLIIITGQTGAGKSILMGALSLLTGAKADAAVISEGADNCVVEGEFRTDDPAVRAILEENGAEWEEGSLLVRRVIHRSGRSRSFVNDCPVQVGVLSALASRLVDIHSQHQNLVLSDPAFQREVLDLFAGDGETLDASRAGWRRLLSLRSERRTIREQLERLDAERDYNEARYKRLEDAKLREGELEELEAEQTRLANAEEIKETLSAVGGMLSPSDGEWPGLVATLKEASRLLSRSETFIPEARELASRLDAARIELDDISSELDRLDAAVDVSPQRLETVEDRMGLLYDLLKKYNCSTEGELIASRDALSSLLYDSTAMEERAEALDGEIAQAERKLEELHAALHRARTEAAPKLAARLEERLRFLELERSVFEVAVDPAQPGENGADAVRFLFSASGKNPVDAARCASGGELSRMMLSLKSLLASLTEMPTMVFDEIDSGVSGSAADKMGSMICTMGDRMQVFAITHLPQVAAKGQAHFLVSKDASGEGGSTIKKLSPEERVFEIARMLSGAVVSEEAVANARRLLTDR